MDALETPSRRFFRRAWWLGAVFMLFSGLWQCYGAWLWQQVRAHV